MIMLIGLLALGALINSFSRTSLMACMASLLFGYRHLYLKKKHALAYLVGGMLLVLALLVLNTQVDLQEKFVGKLELLSKSGDADELTTATGRSDIWAHAFHLLGDRPVTGYGAATQKYYFQDHSLYTHNLVINIAFSAGIFAGITAVFMILMRIRLLFVRSYPLADAIAVFIIVNGLFENVIFSILAGLPTMLWILALAWPLVPEEDPDNSANKNNSRFLNLESP
jgi:O-antigen ligase